MPLINSSFETERSPKITLPEERIQKMTKLHEFLIDFIIEFADFALCWHWTELNMISLKKRTKLQSILESFLFEMQKNIFKYHQLQGQDMFGRVPP